VPTPRDRRHGAAPQPPLQPDGRAAAEGHRPRLQLRGRAELLDQPSGRHLEVPDPGDGLPLRLHRPLLLPRALALTRRLPAQRAGRAAPGRRGGDDAIASVEPHGRVAIPPARRGGSLSLALVGVGLGASAAAAWLVTRGVDAGDVGSALGSARALPLAIGIVLILASYPLLAARWRVIVRQTAPAPSEGRMLELVLVGAAVNNVLPGRLGEI